jgi:hypothetical protein
MYISLLDYIVYNPETNFALEEFQNNVKIIEIICKEMSIEVY